MQVAALVLTNGTINPPTWRGQGTSGIHTGL
jgi:hypothetical protein